MPTIDTTQSSKKTAITPEEYLDAVEADYGAPLDEMTTHIFYSLLMHRGLGKQAIGKDSTGASYIYRLYTFGYLEATWDEAIRIERTQEAGYG